MKLYLLLTAIFLCILSISDLRTRTIPGWSAVMFCAVMGVLHLVRADLPILEILAGMVPGLVLLLLSKLFSASLGMGDGLVVLACGCALGPEREFAALTAALVFCGIFSIILLILKRAKRTDCLPFLPFLAASHLVMLISEVIS